MPKKRGGRDGNAKEKRKGRKLDLDQEKVNVQKKKIDWVEAVAAGRPERNSKFRAGGKCVRGGKPP